MSQAADPRSPPAVGAAAAGPEGPAWRRAVAALVHPDGRIRPRGWLALAAIHVAVRAVWLATARPHPMEAEELFVGGAADVMAASGEWRPWVLSPEPYTQSAVFAAASLLVARSWLGPRILALRVLMGLLELALSAGIVRMVARHARGEVALLTGLGLALASATMLAAGLGGNAPHAHQWMVLGPLAAVLHAFREAGVRHDPRARLRLAWLAGGIAGLGCSYHLLLVLGLATAALLAASGFLGRVAGREATRFAAGVAVGLAPMAVALLATAGVTAPRAEGMSADMARIVDVTADQVLSWARLLQPAVFATVGHAMLFDPGEGPAPARAAASAVPSALVLALAVLTARRLLALPRGERRNAPWLDVLAAGTYATYLLVGFGPGATPFATSAPVAARYQLGLYPLAVYLAARAAWEPRGPRWGRWALPGTLSVGALSLGLALARGPEAGALDRPDGSLVWIGRNDVRRGLTAERIGERLAALEPVPRWTYAFGAGAGHGIAGGPCPAPSLPIAADPGLAEAHAAGCCFALTLGASGATAAGTEHAVEPAALLGTSAPGLAPDRAAAACAAGVVDYVRHAVPEGSRDRVIADLARLDTPAGRALAAAWARGPRVDLFGRRVTLDELRRRGLAEVGVLDRPAP